MTTNQSPEYLHAQKRYLQAQTDEEKLQALEEMLSTMPGHKGAESMRANLRARYKKLKEDMEKKRIQKKQTKGKEGIKKEGVQVVLAGLTHSGKSSLISILTNAHPQVGEFDFTTKYPIVGMLNYEGIDFQMIDMPAINYETFDNGVANGSEIILIVINNLQDIPIITQKLERAIGKRIIVYNKSDLLEENEKRKLEATLKSKRYNFVFISCKTREGIEELKKKLVENSGVIRIYTKQPGKPADSRPVIFKDNPNIEELAEKILNGFSRKIKETRIWGPSSKFPGQKVGLSHILKDKDIVEFKTF